MKNRLRVLVALVLSPLWIGEAKAERCFDWEKGVPAPLKAPVAYNGKKEISKAGTDKKGFVWGYARGKVAKPISTLYPMLLDHFTVKDPKKVKLRVYDQPKAGYLNFHLVMVTVLNVPLSVEWEENWAYSLLEGTAEKPKKILIQNQKEVGSNFLKHLCGTIILEALTDKETDVFIYEELDAVGKRTEADTKAGHLGTLNTLRK